MYRCIEVRGYLAFFDVQESQHKYVITRDVARRMILKNKGRTIPIVISHVDFRVDLTIGYVTELKIDNKGLHCIGVVDNSAFLKVQQELNDDFIRYFTKADPSPLLYLRSCLPCFSLSHELKTLLIKHVALVDLGARRGTLIKYSYANAGTDKRYTSTEIDFYKMLNCYTRNTIKLGPERNSLLFKDALFCGETDTEFINAGFESEKNTIKASGSHSKRKDNRLNIMSQDRNNAGMDEAFSFLNNLASVLSRTRNLKRSSTEKCGGSANKRARMDDDEPIINASQTLVNPDQHKRSNGWQQEMDEFRNQMKQMQSEFLNAQSTLIRGMIGGLGQQQNSQDLTAMYQNQNFNQQAQAQMATPGTTHPITSQQIQSQPQIQSYNGQCQTVPNGYIAQQLVHPNVAVNTSYVGRQPSVPNQVTIQTQLSGQQPVQYASTPGKQITPPSQLVNQHANQQQQIQQQQTFAQVPQQQCVGSNVQQPIQQQSAQLQQDVSSDIPPGSQTEERSERSEQPEQPKSAETILVEAGMDVNKNVHLLNELFRQFIDTNFAVRNHVLK